MNVTPLVDVVLVLLIIFMVVTPMLSKQFYVHLPKQEKNEDTVLEQDPTKQALLLRVDERGKVSLNGFEVDDSVLVDKLRRVLAARSDHTVFFDAADSAAYGRAVELLDKARAGGAVTLSILVKRPKDAKREK